ncbi:MAG: hypothetical protein HYX78_03730 [Armatimonadetes bacterium]|nr:hypothetical protein [Armatimonadota bacterium]
MKQDFLVAGIDGGGTKTECAIVNSHEECLGVGVGGPSNIVYVGIKTVCESVQSACRAAAGGLGNTALSVRATGCATLPIGNPDMEAVVKSHLGGEVCYYSEGEVSLACIDVFDRVGIACVAGTGSNCFGFGEGGRRLNQGGWGFPLGDEGGGSDIALHGLRAVGKAVEQRGPATRLVDLASEFFGEEVSQSFLTRLVPQLLSARAEMAGFARMVSRAAHEGDDVARRIIESAADELSTLILSVAGKLFAPDAEFPVALHGGVFSDNYIADRVASAVREAFPLARVACPVHRPGVGAALLTLHDLRANPDYASAVASDCILSLSKDAGAG